MWIFSPRSSSKQQIEQILAEISGVHPARPLGRWRSCALWERGGDPSCLVLCCAFHASHCLLHLGLLCHPWDQLGYPTRSGKGCRSSSGGLFAFELLNFVMEKSKPKDFSGFYHKK